MKIRRGLLAAAAGAAFLASGSVPEGDPLAAEISRWARFLRENTATDALWADVKPSTEPALARAEAALKDGRRLLALQRLAPVQSNLAAAAYLQSRPEAARQDPAAFEAEWARMGRELAPDLGPVPGGAALAGVRPAAVRALGEAALPQVKVYYDTSLEYGRNTMPDSGLFYVGSAAAQRDFVRFCRGLREAAPGADPPLRSLAPELESLEQTLLAAYRPPASIDRHSEFIAASAAIKEAQELDAAGLRYGAMLRYLQARQRAAPLRRPAAPADEAALRRSAAEWAGRLGDRRVDHSIGRVFLESAEHELAHPAAGKPPELAPVMLGDVLPAYFAALEPAPRRPAPHAAAVTVTLVRWPYT